MTQSSLDEVAVIVTFNTRHLSIYETERYPTAAHSHRLSPNQTQPHNSFLRGNIAFGVMNTLHRKYSLS